MYKNRKSIRLKNYDYTKAGLYFLTICANHRKSLFGDVDNNIMVPNDAGRMIEKWYFELENKFKNIKCHQMVVMPNHIHFIVEIEGRHTGLPLQHTNTKTTITKHENPVGADLCVCPSNDISLHEVVQWFKTMTTNEYIRGVKNNNWEPFDKKMWQRNYWEHIVRNEASYVKLSEYIENNPQKWELDSLHPDNAEVLNVK